MVVKLFKSYVQDEDYNKFRFSEIHLLLRYRVKKYLDGDIYRGKLIDGKKNGFATLINEVRNHIYIGFFKDDLFNGKGFLQFSNNDVYVGVFECGVFHGKGILFKANGDIFKGDFKLNEFSGTGSFSSPTGLKYEGEFYKWAKSGVGYLCYPNGDKYRGVFENDFENGKGELYLKDGTIFSGSFVDGYVSGHGVLTKNHNKYTGFFNKDVFLGVFSGVFKVEYSNGDMYNGFIVNGIKNGIGTLVSDGSTYAGSFVSDVKQGHGTLTQHNGCIYVGDFHNNKFHGHGKLTINTKSKINSKNVILSDVYSGSFKNGLYDGVGELIYNDGTRYKGEFRVGKKNGLGVLYSDSFVYEGHFVDDFKCGSGLMKFKDGAIYQGNFLDDMWNDNGKYITKNGDIYNAFFYENSMYSFEINLKNGDKLHMNEFTLNDYKYIYKNGNYLKGFDYYLDNNDCFVSELYDSNDNLLQIIEENSDFKLPDIIYNNPINVYDCIKNAIRDNVKVEMFYLDTNRNLSIRAISDIKYTRTFGGSSNKETHIKAFCHKRNEERNFKIERIKFVRFL